MFNGVLNSELHTGLTKHCKWGKTASKGLESKNCTCRDRSKRHFYGMLNGGAPIGKGETKGGGLLPSLGSYRNSPGFIYSRCHWIGFQSNQFLSKKYSSSDHWVISLWRGIFLEYYNDSPRKTEHNIIGLANFYNISINRSAPAVQFCDWSSGGFHWLAVPSFFLL